MEQERELARAKDIERQLGILQGGKEGGRGGWEGEPERVSVRARVREGQILPFRRELESELAGGREEWQKGERGRPGEFVGARGGAGERK